MKALMTLLAVVLFSNVSMASSCTENVKDFDVLGTIDSVLDEYLNRSGSPFENALSLKSFEPPKFCEPTSSGKLTQMTTSTHVFVTETFEDGQAWDRFDTCFIYFEKYGGKFWSARQIVCLELDVDEDI